jgi:glycosyltransferase involved in cell wall biosynthesis
MKIAVLTGTFHPEPGGPPTYLYHMLPALQAQGHDIRVLTYGETHAEQYPYPVQRVSRRAAVPIRLGRYTGAALRLARWADVLYVQGYSIPLLLIRPFFGGRVVTKVVSDFSWEYARRHQLTDLDVVSFQTAHHPVKLRLLRGLYHHATRLADAIIVPSDHVARLVAGWGVSPARINVVFNAIPDSGLQHTDRQTLRRELGLPLDRRLLVSVGRLTPVKGVDVAIRAMQHLPDCDFVIVGEGEQRAELETLAEPYAEHIHFVGRKPHETVLRYIRAADVFVLSSYTEGLSHVLLEALSVGTPAVATAVGGNTEVLTDGLNGLLVPPGEPEALTEAIRQVIEHEDQAEKLIQEGFRRSADFSWQNTVIRTEQILCG